VDRASWRLALLRRCWPPSSIWAPSMPSRVAAATPSATASRSNPHLRSSAYRRADRSLPLHMVCAGAHFSVRGRGAIDARALARPLFMV